MLSYSIAREIFPDQGSNPCLLHGQADSLPQSHQGSPYSWVLRVFCFFFLIYIYMCVCVCVCMCVLDNSPFQMCLFIYFLSVYDLSSYSLTLRFTKQKFLLLIKSSLSVISFIEQTFGIISKKGLSYPRSSSFSPMFSSRIFDSFAFYIEVFDPFWMNSEEVYLHSFFFSPRMWMSSCSSTICWKDYLCSIAGVPNPKAMDHYQSMAR